MNIILDKISFNYDNHSILNSLSGKFESGDIVLLNGKSGSGKTTFLKILNSMIKPMTGFVFLNSTNLNEYSQYDVNKQIGFISQSPDLQLVGSTVQEEIEFGLTNLGVSDIKSRIDFFLEQLGLSNRRNQSTSSLSGGQKQKLVLASILAMKPDVILMDEPLSQLDLISAKEFVEFIKKINHELNTLFIIVEHRTDFLESLCNKKYTLENGQLSSYQPYPESYKSLSKATSTSKKLLVVEDLSFKYENTKILNSISFNMNKRERIAIWGENGAGKSTLLQLICGIIKETDGSVNHYDAFSVIFQNPDLMLIENTVFNEIKSNELLSDLDLECFQKSHPLTLSKGQRLRCAFGASLQYNTELIIMDEPTTGQDIQHINQIINCLENKSVLFCSHDKLLVESIATRIIKLESGKVTYDGAVELFDFDS